MGHKSRVCSVLFDVDPSSYEEAARFWSGALGRPINFDPADRYTVLEGELNYEVQSARPGREGMHIDIETDDVDAEVARLEKLGARKREKVHSWWVMISPGGHPFCVVKVQSKTWPDGAVEWDS
jgi:hypothetical protein